MKKLLTIILLLSFGTQAFAFCGFYVAKADATLFNKSSKVILVRDGNTTTITMSNDYQGEVKDFAMVVPVPVVLQRSQIRTVKANLFDKIDAATAPRMSAYYDQNPCPQPNSHFFLYDSNQITVTATGSTLMNLSFSGTVKSTVVVEAKYEVGEYDILILSAKESAGLEDWLIHNGYKIPVGAKEVLEPYVKSDLKFFVVKVNTEKHRGMGSQSLTPLQITFDSPKFILPIRLGMANANGDQDLIVYSFTRNGRVEPTNYRLAEMPHDREVPLFVQNEFGQFYKDAFDVNWKREGKNAVMLEYAWDISGTQPVKCDPCPSPLLTYSDLNDAGVKWITEQDPKWGQGLYNGDLFVTRMHVRYNRSTFPQDLAFQTTPNKTNFQCRYVIHHPATGDLSCEPGQEYIRTLLTRRYAEMLEMNKISGWKMDGHETYLKEYEALLTTPQDEPEIKDMIPVSGPSSGKPISPLLLFALGFGLLGAAFGIRFFLRKSAITQ